MEKHITLVAIMSLGLGALGILGAAIGFAVLVVVGLVSGDPTGMSVMTILATVVAGFITLTSLPAIVGGIGLLKRRPWARILMLVVGVLELPNIPLGTALGVYTLWVMIHDETRRILETRPPA
jgi:hypothetical protein